MMAIDSDYKSTNQFKNIMIYSNVKVRDKGQRYILGSYWVKPTTVALVGDEPTQR